MDDLKTLINRVRNSGLDELKKENLIELLPFMNDEQKSQLLELIEKANEMRAMKRESYKKMEAFKADYKKKLESKKQELLRYGRSQLQQIESHEAEEVLKALN